jgi:hypothetical protein
LPYEDYYDLNLPFELGNVTPGKHILRVFVSRPWHESYKNDGAFQLVDFTVSAGRETERDGSAKTADEVRPTNPLLTYNRPKGDYKGADSDPIMIDFWLSNAKLKRDGGDFRIRYFVDDDDARFIDNWEPIWLQGWTTGKHTVHLELLGNDGWPVKNGGYNVTTRGITIVR